MGGGTDLPSFFEQEEGATLSASINKYIYVGVHKRFDKSFRIAYENTENCLWIDQIVHPVARAILTKYELKDTGLDVLSASDIPSGTGLGSSSCYTVGLLNSMHRFHGRIRTPEELAAEACEIEFSQNVNAIGRQDQYAVSMGGINVFRFLPNGEVRVEPISVKKENLRRLEESILLFYTGLTRPAARLLKKQSENVTRNREVLQEMKSLVFDMRDQLEGDFSLSRVGNLLSRSWELKRTLAEGITNDQIESWYKKAYEAGAYGGKLMGAGGGGFMMFCIEPENQKQVIEALSDLRYSRVRIDQIGTRAMELKDEE